MILRGLRHSHFILRSTEHSSRLPLTAVTKLHPLFQRNLNRQAPKPESIHESFASKASIYANNAKEYPNQPAESSRSKETHPPTVSKRQTDISTRYISFLERYQQMLGKKFPGALNVYRVFVVGFKDFVSDVKEYLVIKKKVMTSSEGVRSLTKPEVDIYFFMPKDMIRVGPVLLFSALPLAQYLVFPIAYYFPRHLLSSHFWSLQQKFEFAIENQRQRLLNYRPVFRHMQSGLDNIKDEKLKSLVQEALNKLGSGSHPTVRQIMEIKAVFESDAFSIQAIHGPHAKRLCKIHGLGSFFLKRRRLYDHAYMLSVMDSVLLRDGIFNLKTDDLKSACYLRGLNASNVARDDLISYLQQWMSISGSVKPHSYSLLLHLPVLLAYNHPNNWVLLKKPT